MRKSKNAKFSAAGLFVTLMVLVFAPAVSLGLDGAGTQASPFLIQTPADYDQLATNTGLWSPNIYFRVTADIDLTGFPFTQPIGNSSMPFRGVFDGDGHTISNFACNHTGRPEVGFFGYVFGVDAKVENLRLRNPVINTGTGHTAAALAARVIYATIENCHVSGGSVTARIYVGGLIGYSIGADIIGCSVSRCDVSGSSPVGGLVGIVWEQTTITNCSSTAATVSGTTDVGGFVGRIVHDATIADSYSSNDVTGTSHLGGFAGYCINAVKIDRCFATGGVEGNLYIGGFAGYSAARISDCYATGSASATAPGPVGGFVGTNAAGLIQFCYSIGRVQTAASGPTGGLVANGAPALPNSFWDQTTSQQPASIGGTGLPTPQMKTAATYLAAGWDFVGETANGEEDIWRMPSSGGYPILPSTKEPYAGGSGTEEDPYQIWDANHMQAIGADPCDWDKYFVLMADIDLSSYTGTSFNIIGYGVSSSFFDANNKPFTGVFDGNGHTISNFTYTSTDANCIGLFGYVGRAYGEYATIKDLGLIDPNVNAGTADYVGTLVGWLSYGSISGCFVQGGSVSGGDEVGGLVGYNDEERIINCYATASVSGNHCVGGLVGENDWDEHSSIRFCYSTASVTGTGLWVGGLVGAGMGEGVSVSFWDVNTSGQTTSGGGTPKTTAEMKTRSTFTDAWWDFVGEIIGIEDIWDICEGTNYPKLSWQIPPVGDFGCPDGVDFFDFSFFSRLWAVDQCRASNNYCDGRDLDLLGSVDIKDLRIFADNWLAGF